MDDTKSFQGYVNQSLMDSGKHIDEDYLTIMTGLFKEGNLNVEQVFMLMRTLVRKQTEESVMNYLDINSDIRDQMLETIGYGWITGNGEYTEHCLNKLKEIGFEKTLGESSISEEEERQQIHCSSCNKITNSSRADYQDEFTCNDCGAEVQEEE
jgi:hypothetical protein